MPGKAPSALPSRSGRSIPRLIQPRTSKELICRGSMATSSIAQLRCLQSVGIKTGAGRGDLDQRQSAAACDEYASTMRTGQDQGRSRPFTSFCVEQEHMRRKAHDGHGLIRVNERADEISFAEILAGSSWIRRSEANAAFANVIGRAMG